MKPYPADEPPPTEGRRGFGKLFAVLGVAELFMLVAALVGAAALLLYLSRALDGGPAVLTPTPVVRVTPGRG